MTSQPYPDRCDPDGCEKAGVSLVIAGCRGHEVFEFAEESLAGIALATEPVAERECLDVGRMRSVARRNVGTDGRCPEIQTTEFTTNDVGDAPMLPEFPGQITPDQAIASVTPMAPLPSDASWVTSPPRARTL